MTIAHKNNPQDVETLIALLVSLKGHNCFRKVPSGTSKGIYLCDIMQEFQKNKSLFICSLQRKS